MKLLALNECTLVGGGAYSDCEFNNITGGYEDCSGEKFAPNGAFGLGLGIIAGGIGVMATVMTACCGSGQKAANRVDRAIAGTICCFPRYAARILFSGFCGSCTTCLIGYGSLAVGGLILGLGGVAYQTVCVPCTP